MKKLKITLFIVAFCAFTYAQDIPGIPLIGEEAPNFKSESTNGTINFPKDFGTLCPPLSIGGPHAGRI